MAVTAAPAGVSPRAAFAHDARMLRVAALIIDLFIFGVISFVVNSVYGIAQAPQGITLGGGPNSFSTIVAWPWLTLLGILYFALPEAMFGATPGKAWARLRVVRLDGRPLSVGSVVARNVLKPIDFLPLLYILGGLLVLLTPGSQRLGDLAGGTTVVFRHRALEPGATLTSTPMARRILYGALVVAVLFTMAFDYFGRPPLVIAGMFNEQFGPMRGVSSYSLGEARWGAGQVTYPVRLAQSGEPAGSVVDCAGSITLDWGWIGGWNAGQSSWTCTAGS